MFQDRIAVLEHCHKCYSNAFLCGSITSNRLETKPLTLNSSDEYDSNPNDRISHSTTNTAVANKHLYIYNQLPLEPESHASANTTQNYETQIVAAASTHLRRRLAT